MKHAYKGYTASLVMMLIEVFIVVIMLVAMASYAFAHDWYPRECCSDRDCRAVDAPREEQGGFYFSSGQWAPYGIVRMSPDGKWHLCEGPGKKLLCVFGPTGGF